MTTSYNASIIFLHSGIPSTSFTLPATPLLSLSFTPVFHQLPLPYHLQRFYHLLSLSHSIPFLHTTINTIPTPYLPSYYHQHHSPSPFPSHSQQHHFYPPYLSSLLHPISFLHKANYTPSLPCGIPPLPFPVAMLALPPRLDSVSPYVSPYRERKIDSLSLYSNVAG